MSKIHLLKKQSSTGDTTDSVYANIVKGHVNKLLLVFPNGSEDYQSIEKSFISVKHVGKRTTNFITKIPLKAFLDISDEQFGSIGSSSEGGQNLLRTFANLQGAISNINDASSAKTCFESMVQIYKHFQQTTQNNIVGCLIDLGSFLLDRGDEIHCSLERVPSVTTSDGNVLRNAEVQFYSVSDEVEENHHFIVYDTDKDANELHQNVIGLYLLQDNNDDYDVFVDSPTIQYQTTKVGATAYANLMGKHEGVMVETINIYDSKIPEDVQVKIVGNNNEVTVMSKRVMTNIESYTEQKREAIKTVATKMENLEKNNPQVANVLVTSGTVPSSIELEVKAEQYRR